MRDIKFRAWDLIQHKMLKPDMIEFIDGNAYWVDASSNGSQQNSNDGPIYSPITRSVVRDGMVLEQYTGLKDIDGKQIYEGDIVEFDEQGYNEDGVPDEKICTGKIAWKFGGFSFAASRSCDAFDDFPLQVSNGDDFKVIGNIHVNPELLEADND